MDAVRALLILPPVAAIPDAELAAPADAIIALPPSEPADYAAFRDRATALIDLGRPLYLAAPPVDSGRARDLLAAALAPGAAGVVVRPPASVEQLRYLESVIEELELKAGIRPGLTAMAVGFGTPRALSIIGECLDAMRRSAGRAAWVAWNPDMLARELGVPAASPTVAQAAGQVVLAAAARGLPAVRWINRPPAFEDITAAAAAGFRGIATTDAHRLTRLRGAFPPGDSEDEAGGSP